MGVIPLLRFFSPIALCWNDACRAAVKFTFISTSSTDCFGRCNANRVSYNNFFGSSQESVHEFGFREVA
jgi:hypothetical protein